ncbi:hypothetical protein G9P44_003155 [Scheffersomyces stipitis]|nr:hypothetical protein G9P44_003155 [Scheffersomyces stipitis]
MNESPDPGDPGPPLVSEISNSEEEVCVDPSVDVLESASDGSDERARPQEDQKEIDRENNERLKEEVSNEVSQSDTEDIDEYEQTKEEEFQDEELDEELEEYEELSEDEEYNDETLASTIIREIQDGTYICLVCTGEIDQHSQVWSCDECYRVYDLDCIKDWALRGSSTDKTSKQWRCPACNVAIKNIPSRFTCWCGRVVNPHANPLSPFSCGNSCNSQYENCVHSCSSICHPGAHPICGAMGPLMKCQCGKEAKQVPCLITPYETGWNCSNPCEIVICDLKHKCKRGCHSGFCGVCEESISLKCYCGKEDLQLSCHEKQLEECHDSEGNSWIGGGRCTKKTRVYYNCNNHYRDLECQPLPQQVEICRLDPSQVDTCYCGKTHVEAKGRTNCTDPIPQCDSRCDKVLPCGCHCLMKCHPGPCECFSKKDIKCACGHETFSVMCRFIQEGYQPKCKHKCSVLLNCRKHYHREQCCQYEQVALKRERDKKKAIRNNTRSNFNDEIMTMEAIHICMKTCNRLKSCGQHYCEALCHPGPCGVCYESTNEDLVCNCGKTVLPAPVRCGSKLVCHEQCVRPKACGHRPEPHECHEDSVACPKCTALVAKECNCGLKADIPGILCSQENVSCGSICTVAMSCGHPCLRSCSSRCTKDNIHNSSSLCMALCKKVRKNCPHLCKMKCHANKVGKSANCDITRCTELVQVTCECGRVKKKVPCGSTVENSSLIGSTLECDEECIKSKRDTELRSAFMVGDANDTLKDEIPYSESVMSTFQAQTTWCSRIENVMRTFVEDYYVQLDQEVKSPKRTFHFPPMTSPQRTFVHELAEAYKLYSESQDKDPKRSVFIVITRMSKLPEMTVAKAIAHKDSLIQEANTVNELKQQDIEKAAFNALIIQDVFFGIVKDDLENELNKYLEKFSNKEPKFQWLKESTFIFYFNTTFEKVTPEDENELYLLSKTLRKVLREKSLAFDCKLCSIDESATYVLKIDNVASTPTRESTPQPVKSMNSFDLLAEENTQIEV